MALTGTSRLVSADPRIGQTCDLRKRCAGVGRPGDLDSAGRPAQSRAPRRGTAEMFELSAVARVDRVARTSIRFTCGQACGVRQLTGLRGSHPARRKRRLFRDAEREQRPRIHPREFRSLHRTSVELMAQSRFRWPDTSCEGRRGRVTPAPRAGGSPEPSRAVRRSSRPDLHRDCCPQLD
jgi:hypothetical protein